MISPTFIRALIALTLAGLFYGVIIFHLETETTYFTMGIIISEISLVLRDHFHIHRHISMCNLILLWTIAIYAITSIGLIHDVYYISPNRVILMIAVAQISDILQFFFGKYYGKHHIGWVSPKKTYEGYFIAFIILESIAILLDLIYPSICGSVGCYIDIFSICLLGALGGIFFSMAKRYLQIKDWSSLLGPHGGFLDRTDSLYLSGFYLYMVK